MMISTPDGYVGLDDEKLSKYVTFDPKTWSAKSNGTGFDYGSKTIGLKNCEEKDFSRNNKTARTFK